jgi:hypothetical protein
MRNYRDLITREKEKVKNVIFSNDQTLVAASHHGTTVLYYIMPALLLTFSRFVTF